MPPLDRKICYIAGAGDFYPGFPPRRGHYVIAADAGYLKLREHGVTADLVVGDFDSLGSAPDHPNVIKVSPIKDETDLGLAVAAGLERGYGTFYINGGLGGRLDLTLANIQTLVWLSKRGARGYLVGDGANVTAVTDGSLSFDSRASGKISVFANGDQALGVTLTGLKYPLTDAMLTSDCPLGVSNEFIGVPAAVSVKHGTLIVMWAGDLDKSAEL